MSKKQKRRLPGWKTFRKPKERAVRAEEVIEIPGLGAIARGGRFVQIVSRRSGDEQAALMQRLAAGHDRVVESINANVEACAAIVSSHEPLALLHRAYFDFFHGMLDIRSEHEVGFEESVDARTLEYIQTLIVSLPDIGPKVPITDEIWAKLRGHIEDMYSTLTLQWPSTDTARQVVAGTVDRDAEEFRVPLLLEWLSVRGNRYQIHEREWLGRMLQPHDAALLRLFGASADNIASALLEVQRRLSKEIGRSMETLHEIHKAVFTNVNVDAVKQDDFASAQEYARALLATTGRAEEFKEAADRAFGTAIFNITELFPRALLDRIALGPGDDETFFRAGEHRGWPLRTPPTRTRPLLRIEDEFYIFDVFTIDYVYRAIERAVMEVDPAYREQWNAGQKQVTESFPIELLSASLPNARVFRDVEYPVRDASGVVKWCECDAVLTIDSLAIVVEVKAGRASDKSPLEDLPAHVRNVRQLLVAPAQQAQRFIDYLNQASEVPLYDREHKELARLRRSDFDLCVPCAVSADSLSAVAGSFQHTPHANKIALAATWCVSIDELLAYRDVLRSPTWLYVFLGHRLRAFAMAELGHVSELDHLGAFLATNEYTQWISQLGANVVALHGYREKLDHYFGSAWENDGVFPDVPRQPLPPAIAQVVAALDRAQPRGFLRAGALLLGLDARSRSNIANAISDASRGLAGTPRSRVLTVGGKDASFYVAVIARTCPAAERHVYRDHALALMLRATTSSAMLIELHMAEDSSVASAGCELLDAAVLGDDERARLADLVDDIAETRFALAREEGVKLGPNDMCLCGSGLKYKKCCRKNRRSP